MKTRGYTTIEVIIIVVVIGLVSVIGWGIWDQYDASFVRSGVIVRKVHTSAWTEIQTIVHTDGKTSWAQTVPIYHPERWDVVIRGYGRNGKVRDRTVNVGELAFNDLERGQPYTVDE